MLKFIPLVLSGITVIGGFIFWHFKTVNGLKEDIHKLELQFKDLEKKVELRQQPIDTLSNLYPLLNKIFHSLKSKSEK